MTKIRLSQLAQMLEGELSGNGDCIVKGVASLESAGADEVSFLSNARYVKQVPASRAAAVIVPLDYSADPSGPTLIRCKDSYFAFRQAMVILKGFRQPEFNGVDPRAVVHPSAKLAEGVKIAALATVSVNAVIGARTVIYPGVYVGPHCRIGEDCIVYPNATLYDGTILGNRVTVHAGASIGHDGFGFATHKGKHEKIPQAGWVELHDDVEIGAGCAIDRATMGPTVIGEGTKFSNLIAIGHGTKLGKHCLMVAQSGIAGSTTVGDYCVFGGQSGACGHISIGDFVRVSAQAGIVGSVEGNQELGGSPAMPLAHVRRVWMTSSRLPKMRDEIRKLQEQIKELRAALDQLQSSREKGEK
ncbi:MAG: UDP-3-O-(3-hydroxymyristoyl)glucosamine N-acyltransferase [Planctomycetes bacterium]|jgi:UDP-3-O-[3-hydroxymyristoyl] glucosamine N-acyltransferase|nr:UDP-3-O-(3-hydroxymyristoyl)glucosamine N-acyltransferase [Planctomycetota bacterium]